jgi:deazaflavin-dependent oxidoreductase (nitroreductase family)
MKESELKSRLTRYRQIRISVIGRKSGKTISIPVWFVLEGEKLYLLPVQGCDTQWYRNVLKNPSIRIDARGAEAEFQAAPITDDKAVKSVVEKFQRDTESSRQVPAASTLQLPKSFDSIAVLPLINASGDPETEYLSDGISESIINLLSRLPNLRVIPRTTAFRYKSCEADLKTLGRDLNVRTLLTGKVIQRGDRLIVRNW